jgi:hypothetical protein
LNNSSLSNEFQMTMVQYKKSITEHINKKAWIKNLQTFFIHEI